MATTMDPSAILAQIMEGFVKLPLAQKIILPLLFVGIFGGIILVSNWAAKPDYTVLYSDLSDTDSAAVIEKLKTQKIKYQIGGDGSTILISPPEMVHELRMTLAAEGIPKGGTVGYELFEGTSLGATTFSEKVKWIRAVQGELERTIMSLDSIATARVHITQPEKTVFAKDAAKPTASVMVRLKGNAELEKKQIKGIQNLVAGSIEGLAKDQVNIVDVYGNLLTPQDEGEEAMGIEATRLQYQQEVERGYVQRVEQMLQKVLGPGKVIARVTTDMDFTSTEREEESFDPSGQVIRSERTINQGVGSSERGGVPGIVSNVPAGKDGGIVSPKGVGEESQNHSELVKNYEVSKAVTKSSLPRGKLVRLSAAVLVDGTYEAAPAASGGAAGATPPKVFKPLDSETMERIQSVVKSAVGYDSARGDSITVENIPFYTPEEDLAKALDKEALIQRGIDVARIIIPYAILFILAAWIVRPLVKFLVTPTDAEVDLSRLLPTGIKELEAELEQERSKPQLPTLEPAVDLEQLEELMSENSRIVKENPHQAALLIRYWLNDGRL